MNLCSDQREVLRTQVGKIYAHVKPIWKNKRVTDPEWVRLCKVLKEMECVLAEVAVKEKTDSQSSQ